MAVNQYVFLTHWQVESTAEEVSAILEDIESYTRWWPSVYLDIQVLEKGGKNGLGKKASLFTKGWLPYTLRWQMQVTESRFPLGFTLKATGDFLGTGIWTFHQNDSHVDARFDWRLAAEKPLLKYLSFLFKPLFAANHRWAMARGLESLKLELLRRRCRSSEEKSKIPAPPQPTFIKQAF
jgi:hypothetical protein